MEHIQRLLDRPTWTDREGRILNPFKDMDRQYIENVEKFIMTKVLPPIVHMRSYYTLCTGPVSHLIRYKRKEK